jgi:hypothetical protein
VKSGSSLKSNPHNQVKLVQICETLYTSSNSNCSVLSGRAVLTTTTTVSTSLSNVSKHANVHFQQDTNDNEDGQENEEVDKGHVPDKVCDFNKVSTLCFSFLRVTHNDVTFIFHNFVPPPSLSRFIVKGLSTVVINILIPPLEEVT